MSLFCCFAVWSRVHASRFPGNHCWDDVLCCVDSSSVYGCHSVSYLCRICRSFRGSLWLFTGRFFRSLLSSSSALPARVRRPAKYCDQLVCVSVCFFPLAYLKNHMSELHEIFARAIPVIVARSASDSDNTLCTFGFVDDAMFSRSSSSSESCSRRGPSHRSTTMTTANSTPPQVECIARDDLTTDH